MSEWRILEGDAMEMLRTLEGNSIDAVVTDPPYEFGFMGKKWDQKAGVSFHVTTWKEVRRVMKPGAHLLAFGGPRTWHRLACAIEDAGLEIRDSIDWIFGTGFPKNLDVGKAIDKKAGAERVVEGRRTDGRYKYGFTTEARRAMGDVVHAEAKGFIGEIGVIASPATDSAKQWDGYGTALKPAHEPIVLARKPLEGTVAANVEKWGTGGINVDGCRVPGAPSIGGERGDGLGYMGGKRKRRIDRSLNSGRWPPNVCLDEAAAAELDRQSEPKIHGAGHERDAIRECDPSGRLWQMAGDGHRFGDSGGASRFFPIFRYEPKASRAERDAGLEGGGRNPHPTVKPVALMQWLCRLVTPRHGLILDPFVGSGSTGIAAIREHFCFIGIDDDPGYVELARRRIEGDAPLFNKERESP